jgi:hypothetical protein
LFTRHEYILNEYYAWASILFFSFFFFGIWRKENSTSMSITHDLFLFFFSYFFLWYGGKKNATGVMLGDPRPLFSTHTRFSCNLKGKRASFFAFTQFFCFCFHESCGYDKKLFAHTLALLIHGHNNWGHTLNPKPTK